MTADGGRVTDGGSRQRRAASGCRTTHRPIDPTTQRGGALIEILVSCLIALLIGTMMLSLIQANFASQGAVLAENDATSKGRAPLDILEDNIRSAQPYGIGVRSALQAASATSITCYTNNTGSTSRFWLDSTANPPALKKTAGGVTSVLVRGVTSLQFTYYVAGGQYTPSIASWTTTVLPTAPTAAELPLVGAVRIATTVVSSGRTRTLTALVRLRNSPPDAH